jgi:hypothetical protein
MVACGIQFSTHAVSGHVGAATPINGIFILNERLDKMWYLNKTLSNIRAILHSLEVGTSETPTRFDLESLTTEGRLRFVQRVEARFGKGLPSEVITAGADLPSLAKVIQDSLDRSSVDSVLRLQRGEGRSLILIVPGIHGTAWSFERLVTQMTPGVDAIGLEYSGLAAGETIPTTIADQVEIWAEKLTFELGGLENFDEVMVFGFCLGGSFAHELLNVLDQHENQRRRLVIFDGHPSVTMAKVGPLAELRYAVKNELNRTMASGRLEKRLIEMGIAQIDAMSNHLPSRIDIPMNLVLSGSSLSLGPVTPEDWSPFVESCEQVLLPDIGHVDFVRHRLEHLIMPVMQFGDAPEDNQRVTV